MTAAIFVKGGDSAAAAIKKLESLPEEVDLREDKPDSKSSSSSFARVTMDSSTRSLSIKTGGSAVSEIIDFQELDI